MAFDHKPLSWTTQASDWGITYTSAPSNPIYWTEAVVPPTSNGRFSLNQSSQAVMSFLTQYNTTTSPDMKILCQSIIGGWNATAGTRKTPWTHPYYANLKAKDIVSVTPYCLDQNNAPRIGAGGYDAAIVTVNFESFPYQTDNGSSPNWISITGRGTNQRLSIPLGWYKYTGSYLTNKPALLGAYYTQGMEFVQMTFYQTPASKVFSTGFLMSIRNFFGFVNNDVFLGYPAGTLLCDSADLSQPYSNAFDTGASNVLYDVTVNFIYTAPGPAESGSTPGWNNTLGADGVWHPTGFVTSGDPPIPTQAFAGILTDMGL